MMLHELNERLKKSTVTEEQLLGLNSLYLLLDLDKDDFCKIVDMLGLEKLLKKQVYYDILLQAEQEFLSKERYLLSKIRLEELEFEKLLLNDIISSCRPNF